MLRPFLAVVLAVACLAQAQAAAPAAKPHIVVFLVDDMGYADAGFMGSREIQTPNLDRLAAAGSVLKSFYVQPVCSPTRSCLMTGRYVAHTGVYTVVRPNAKWGLPVEERTLAQALRDSGYATAIVGKWHLGEFEAPFRPMKRGFDQQYGLWFGMVDHFTHRRGKQLDWHRNDEPSQDEGYSTHLLSEEACRVVREHREKPLFLYVPFNAVHAPYQVPEKYRAPYGSLSGNRRTYAGMISAVDEAVGKIVAALKEKGMLENTLILFSSDNGGPAPGRVTSNGPLRAGKGTIYEGGIRACAFASWPGKIPAGSIDEPLHIVDWYPTLLRLAGASTEQKRPIDGKDIWPVLAEKAKSPHDSILLCGTSPERVAIRSGHWKLLLNASERDAEDAGPEKGEQRTASNIELYDLSQDIGEKNNLAPSQGAKVKELREKLEAWRKGFVRPGGE